MPSNPTIQPQHAPVVPRARRLPNGEVLPLDQIIRQFIRHNERGVIQLLGAPGSGKTTALKHLAAVLPREAGVLLCDGGTPGDLGTLARQHLIVCASEDVHPYIARLAMAPWGEDDRIEYLLAIHPQRCAAVMTRLRQDDGAADLDGSPMLWRVVLDRFVADDSLRFAASALRMHIFAMLEAHRCARAAKIWCLKRVRQEQTMFELPEQVMPLLLQRFVQVLLAAEHLTEMLSEGTFFETLDHLPRGLIREAALLLCARPAAQRRLKARVYLNSDHVAGAVSLLVRIDPTWTPRLMQIDLQGAILEGAQWAGIDLSNANLSRTDFTGAELSGADFHGARARMASFAGAKLRRADSRYLNAAGAVFMGADLSGSKLGHADLKGANLQRADLRGAACCGADLAGANLGGACLAQADLSDTSLVAATLGETDLTRANLAGACLERVRLADCRIDGASFHDANLSRCDLENMRASDVDFSSANLSRALLTGSILRNANFRAANLARAGLAKIDWERADLRKADLRAATFHLGSTRSGLVGSTTPCHGSKTGFYTDERDEQDYKSPEEIRKANLCGADLRGAKIKGVDFYLVDLRYARYTKRQARYFRKCGAIL